MREQWARTVAGLAGSLVVGVAIWFAWRQNPPPVQVPTANQRPVSRELPAAARPEVLSRGREAYADLACARCHSIAGQGGGRSVLDGVGSRLGEADIRAWLTPDPTRRDFQSRHAGVPMTAEQREDLIRYLQNLR